MSQDWPVVSLGELIRLERRADRGCCGPPYQEIGNLLLWGVGIFHKRIRAVAWRWATRTHQLRKGDLILQVDSSPWEGAIALCSQAEGRLAIGSTLLSHVSGRRISDASPPFIARYLGTPMVSIRSNSDLPGFCGGGNRVLSIIAYPRDRSSSTASGRAAADRGADRETCGPNQRRS